VRYTKFNKLPELNVWTPTTKELAIHAASEFANLPCTIKWSTRMKAIEQCVFLLPKYRQLIYWITTDSTMSGDRIKAFSQKWKCPRCPGNQAASPTHMFQACALATRVWAEMDRIGTLQWGNNYTPFVYNEVPVLLQEYDPVAIYKVGILWAIWTQWTDFMYDPEFTQEDQNNWVQMVVTRAKAEFYKRIYEMSPMIKWVEIVADRKIKRRDDDDRTEKTPEKEFLLVQAQSINTNPRVIDPENEMVKKWLGTHYLLEVHTQHHRPRLRIKHHIWQQHIQALGARPPSPPPIRNSNVPACVAD
jgi:hypothetical protein